jgi:hypothetical protein
MVARTLGLEPTWSSLKEIRTKLGALFPADEHKPAQILPTTDTQAV